MLNPSVFLGMLKDRGIEFYTGVPDSLLKDLIVAMPQHTVAVNEGSAIALAAGYHLATGKHACVYMQNSGMGNAVNPLVSLADPAVYGIGMLILMGYRGQPGTHDEPQHLKQGQVSEGVLRALGIPFRVLSEVDPELTAQLDFARSQIHAGPVVLLVPKDSFVHGVGEKSTPVGWTRAEAIETVAAKLPPQAAVVSSTGMISRELFTYRKKVGQGHSRDFLTVGSMGHASQIALGIAMQQPKRPVVCLDGDGALLMHMGSLASIGQSGCANLMHICLNNGCHDSVGGTPTLGQKVDLCAIAKACGYVDAVKVARKAQLEKALGASGGPRFIDVIVPPGAREAVGRPDRTPGENKQSFMEHLQHADRV